MKKGFIAAIAVAIMSLLLAVAMGAYMLVTNANKQEKYVLYVGVADFSSNIEKQVDDICKKHVDGYTVIDGEGGWTNEDDVFVKEETRIYTFCFTNVETVEAIAKEIISTIKGSSVLMETVENTAVHSSSGVFGEYVDAE